MFTFGLCRLLGFPLYLSSRLFPFSSALRVSCVCLYLLAILLFIGYGPITGIISCSGYLLLALLFVFWFLFAVAIILHCLFGGYFLSLVLLLLGLMSAKSRPHVQLIRAELSSKKLIRTSLGVAFQAELSSNPSLSEGPLQLKSCTRISSLFSPTTPSGASVPSAFFSHSALHFDFGVEQACSAAARVLLACPSRASLSFFRL